ncbi:MAG: HK97 gp10 family phage protein [Planctomycetales bacterium]
MRIHLSIADPSPAVRALERHLARLREGIATAIARRALERVIERTPVETGRLRAAWTRALQEIGGTVPFGSEGGDAGAVAEGAALGSATVRETAGGTEIEIENAVPYAAAIEHGPRGRGGERIVARALADTAAELRWGGEGPNINDQ